MVARDIVRRRMAAATFPIGIMESVIFQAAEPKKKSVLKDVIAEKSLEAQEYAQVNIYLPPNKFRGHIRAPEQLHYKPYRSIFICLTRLYVQTIST